MFNYSLSDVVRSWEQHLACMLPSKVNQLIRQSGRQCNWHQTAFSFLIPTGRDFASLNEGGKVSLRLTTPGMGPVPPSAVLNSTTGACWSFRGTSGTFGVTFDVPSVMPSHVVIHHRPCNSMEFTDSRACAPHKVIVWGLVDGEANMRTFYRSRRATPTKVPSSISKEGVFLSLAEIQFDILSRSLRQVFPISDNVLSWGIDFGVVVFDIRSNWGADTTSLCSVRVYGHTFRDG